MSETKAEALAAIRIGDHVTYGRRGPHGGEWVVIADALLLDALAKNADFEIKRVTRTVTVWPLVHLEARP